MWQDTTKGNGRADQSVEFLVPADRKLEMAGCDTLHLEILGGVSGEFEDFSGEVFEDRGYVDSSLGSDSHLVLGLRLEETLDTSTWELGRVLCQYAVARRVGQST